MGINTKSVAAKERKNEKAAAEKAAKEAAIEDAKWKDDGNPLAKKQVSHILNILTLFSNNLWMKMRFLF